LITVGFLSAIAIVWAAVLTGRRGRLVGPAITAVGAEAIVVGPNHGDGPLGPIGDRVGDPVPFFELLLSPRAARRAILALGTFTGVGVALIAARGGNSAAGPGAVIPGRWS
jgi:hypothetical protein